MSGRASNFDLKTATAQIISIEQELLKLNAQLRLNQMQPPWQGRFWFLVNLTNTSLTAAGADINGFGRFSYLHANRIRRAPRDLFEHATWLRVIANEETVAGASVETAALLRFQRRDNASGLDLKTVHARAAQLYKELDRLLSQRSLACADLPQSERQRAQFQQAVMLDVRQLAAGEFAGYLASGYAGKTVNYLGYLLSLTGNAIAGAGGITANHATMIDSGTARYRTRLAGTGGIADIIASSINMTVPFDLRYAGRWVFRTVHGRIFRELHCSSSACLADLHRHIDDYQKLSVSQADVAGSVVGDSTAIFNRQAAIFDEHAMLDQRDVGSSKRRFASQVIFSDSAGSTKLTNGIGSTVGAFKYTANAHERFEAVGGPAIAYGSGYCVATAELLRNQLWLELQERHRRKDGTSPRQVLTREINALEKDPKAP